MLAEAGVFVGQMLILIPSQQRQSIDCDCYKAILILLFNENLARQQELRCHLSTVLEDFASGTLSAGH